MNEDRRPGETRLRIGILVCSVASLIAVVGTGVCYLNDRPLLDGPTRRVTGTVVSERKGFLGIRNLLTASYEVDGRTYEATIPVKGDGFRGPRIDPYFYGRGLDVLLLVRPGHPTEVRTASRWTPASYNWAAIAATLTATTLLLLVIRWLARRRR